MVLTNKVEHFKSAMAWMIELTDESAVDVQVQELENFFRVVGSGDERSFVDWTHFEKLEAVSYDLLEGAFGDRIQPVGDDRKNRLSAAMVVIYLDGNGGISGIHAVLLTLLRTYLHRRG